MIGHCLIRCAHEVADHANGQRRIELLHDFAMSVRGERVDQLVRRITHDGIELPDASRIEGKVEALADLPMLGLPSEPSPRVQPFLT